MEKALVKIVSVILLALTTVIAVPVWGQCGVRLLLTHIAFAHVDARASAGMDRQSVMQAPLASSRTTGILSKLELGHV